MVIGFANGVVDYPSFLKDAGYDVQNVSPSFLNSEGDRVNTDVIFGSHRYVLVVECEGEELAEDVVSKLNSVDIDSLRTEFRRVVTNSGVEHQIVYAGLDSIESDLNNLDIHSPAILYDTDDKRLNQMNDFDDKELERRVTSATIDYIPSQFIPILSDDHPALIAEKVYQKLCSETFAGGATTDPHHIAEQIYENYWEELSGAEKQGIIDKVDTALSEFESKNAERHMRKLEDSDRQYFVNTSDAFMKRCQRAIQDLADDDSYQGTFERFD
jgi:hypothetical protein